METTENRDTIPVFFILWGKGGDGNDWTRIGGICQKQIGCALCIWNGMKGKVMTEAIYNSLKKAYGNMVWDSDKQKIGKVCCDCSGLISWATGIARNSQNYHDTALEVQPIATIANAPIGVAVWRKGHIGIYIGNGEYIAEDGSAYGCRINKLCNTNFTHWLKLIDIDYSGQEDTEMVEKSKIIVNGKEYFVERILKDGTNYIKIRDLADAFGYTVSNNGSIPVLTKK